MSLSRRSWSRITTTAKAALDRAGFLTLLAAAFAILLFARVAPDRLDRLTIPLLDTMTPVLAHLRWPVDQLRLGVEDTQALLAAYRENRRLKAEIEQLRRLIEPAERMASENAALRALLHMPAPRQANVRLAARIINETGGPFVRTALVDAGSGHGVTPGMAAINGDGLAGRVIKVGRQSARLLLLTDLNSKVPVMIEPSRDQAILAGTNTGQPLLTFLPLAPRLAIGDRVVTSGQGGVLPAGLLVGRIARIENGGIHVATAVDWHSLDHVRLLEPVEVLAPEADDGQPVSDRSTRPVASSSRRRRRCR